MGLFADGLRSTLLRKALLDHVTAMI